MTSIGSSISTTSVGASITKSSSDPVLGPELVGNGVNITATTGWAEARGASTLSTAGGNIVSTADGTNTHGMSFQIDGLMSGASYQVNLDVDRSTHLGSIITRFSTASTLSDGNLVTFANPNDGNVNQAATATATTMYIGAIATGSTAGVAFGLGNVSVRRVL